MDLPEFERSRRGEAGLSIRALARKDMGFWDIDEIPSSLRIEYSRKCNRDHFFPNDGNSCKILVQIQRDISFLEILKDCYPLDYLPINV